MDFCHVCLKPGSEFQVEYLQGVEYGESGEGRNSPRVVLQVVVVKNGFGIFSYGNLGEIQFDLRMCFKPIERTQLVMVQKTLECT